MPYSKSPNPLELEENLSILFNKPLLEPCWNIVQTLLEPCSNLAETLFRPCWNLVETLMVPWSNLAETLFQPCWNLVTCWNLDQTLIKPWCYLGGTLLPPCCHHVVTFLLTFIGRLYSNSWLNQNWLNCYHDFVCYWLDKTMRTTFHFWRLEIDISIFTYDLGSISLSKKIATFLRDGEAFVL